VCCSATRTEKACCSCARARKSLQSPRRARTTAVHSQGLVATTPFAARGTTRASICGQARPCAPLPSNALDDSTSNARRQDLRRRQEVRRSRAPKPDSAPPQSSSSAAVPQATRGRGLRREGFAGKLNLRRRAPGDRPNPQGLPRRQCARGVDPPRPPVLRQHAIDLAGARSPRCVVRKRVLVEGGPSYVRPPPGNRATAISLAAGATFPRPYAPHARRRRASSPSFRK
jgi:hypothetical protein